MGVITPVGRVPPGKDGTATPTMTGPTNGAEQDVPGSRIIMVQERLLEVLLLTPAATANIGAPAEEQWSSSLPSPRHQPTGDEDSGRSAPVSMDVEGEGDSSGTSGAEGGVAGEVDPTTGKSDLPTAFQVVASMVDRALQVKKALKYLPHRAYPTKQTQKRLMFKRDNCVVCVVLTPQGCQNCLRFVR